jgi:acetoin utilization protein AcuB
MFYIIEQGSRIKTSVSSLLQTAGVSPVSASAAVKAAGADSHNSELNKLPGGSRKSQFYQHGEAASPRSQIFFAYQIMTSPVVTASVHATVSDVWVLFSKQNFHHLPLLDDQGLIQGIVSDRDILRFAANSNRQVGDIRLDQLMTRKVISAEGDAEVRVIAEVMCQQRIGALPIVNELVEVAGIVSRSDILRTLVHRAPLELWA